MGYKQPVITLNFPELTDNPDTDPIRVVIRNPRLMAAGELSGSADMAVGPDGQPVESAENENRAYKQFAKMVIGWRVYDATADIVLDQDMNVIGDSAQLLPLPATPDLVAKLPLVILTRLSQELQDAMNPKASQESSTGRTS